jgi:hypothetical protein
MPLMRSAQAPPGGRSGLGSARHGIRLLAALAALLGLTLGTWSLAQASGTGIASCALGQGVPGLSGYYSSALGKAADAYAAGLTGDSSATRAKARQAFVAAAAAYVYGFPQVVERATVRHFARNEIISVDAVANPQVKTVVAPNVDTAYTVSWLDLTTGPMVINVPDTDGRYYTFQFMDAFTNAFAYLGSGSTGTRAGAYVLIPPGYQGSIPAGLHRIYTPSNTIWLLGRTLVKNPSDLPAVKRLQEQYEATPLGAWERGTREPPVVLSQYPPTIPKSVPGGAQFIAALNQEMNIDPPPAAQDCALRAMAPAGIAVPHPTPEQSLLDDLSDEAPPLPTEAHDPAVNAALTAGVAGGSQLVSDGETHFDAASRGANNGWQVFGSWVGAYGTRYLARSLVATVLLAANTPKQSIYPIADTDVTGRVLNGANRYTIRFPRGQLPPVNSFWSLTMYAPSFFLYPNSANRYAIGDRTPGLVRGRDGSLTIYVQHNPPSNAAQRSNWLPAPGGQFHLILRLYLPKASASTGHWKPAPVVRAGAKLASRLRRLRVRPGAFRAASRGAVAGRPLRARVTYIDAGAGVVHLTILRLVHRRGCHATTPKRCTVARTVVHFTHRDRAGADHLFLTGRAHRRRLAPGRYELRVSGSGSVGLTHASRLTARFRIRTGSPKR